jgi:hypothetical protein
VTPRLLLATDGDKITIAALELQEVERVGGEIAAKLSVADGINAVRTLLHDVVRHAAVCRWCASSASLSLRRRACHRAILTAALLRSGKQCERRAEVLCCSDGESPPAGYKKPELDFVASC